MTFRKRALILIGILTAGLTIAAPARALSVRDFEAMPENDRSAYVVSFLEKMAAGIGQQNPELAQRIKLYYSRRPPGKPMSEGMERIGVELAALDTMAEKGQIDLAKIQIESVVVAVTKRQFPPADR